MIIEFLILVLLILMSATFSGMTIGVFSLSLTTLEAKAKLGDKRAQKIIPIRKNGSLLLATLLFGNVAVNTAVAIILNSIAGGFIAGIVSTVLIVIFGELLPQAVFARYALSLGSKIIWLVKIFIVILYPVAAPAAFILDKMLGKESPLLFSKQEFSEIIKKHEESPDSAIDSDEERILLGALSFSDRIVYDVMTPKTVVYHLNKNTILNIQKLEEIKQIGYSRIPVFDTNTDNMLGILFVKDLLGISPSDDLIIESLIRKDRLVYVEWNFKLDKVLDMMVKSHNHLAVVIDEFGVFNGIVTLEDIVEEILKIEIVDEQDKIIDLQKHAREKLRNRLA
ncbi:MAG TPA: hemolysin family protein [Candidatus Kapabacteria bacterium]|nr:hemolysin family protein [Candidatus Kapabacteria bacterium]